MLVLHLWRHITSQTAHNISWLFPANGQNPFFIQCVLYLFQLDHLTSLHVIFFNNNSPSLHKCDVMLVCNPLCIYPFIPFYILNIFYILLFLINMCDTLFGMQWIFNIGMRIFRFFCENISIFHSTQYAVIII